jgi:hypothetical protein
MLVGVFFGKNGGRAASGVAAEKKIYFFSPFVSRTHVSRGKWRVLMSRPRCAGWDYKSNMKLTKCLNNEYKTPSFRQAPECPLFFHHMVGWLVP